jgi:hypothetical protein
MAKANKGGNATKGTGAQAPAATTVQAATVVQAGKPAQPGVLQVKPGVALRGARASWYAVLLQYNGKPVAEFLAATAANPPSLPKSGVAEKPTGWLGWFTRTGVAQVVQPGTESVQGS